MVLPYQSSKALAAAYRSYVYHCSYFHFSWNLGYSFPLLFILCYCGLLLGGAVTL